MSAHANSPHDSPDVLVIGAGPAGLAAAAELQAAGLRVRLLDRGTEVGHVWRGHYDRLHLHTPRELSHLPRLRIPRRFGRWIARDDVARYLRGYARTLGLDVEHGVDVERVERGPDDRGWALACADGRARLARFVVVATGYNREPIDPAVPGASGFTGRLLVSRDYRDGEPFAGQRVLVVGTGNSGMEIAVDLVEHGARDVLLAVRTPPHIVRRATGPWTAAHNGILIRHVPTVVADRIAALLQRLTVPDLRPYGLARPREGLLTRVRRDGAIPVQDVGIVDAIRSGRVRPVAALAAFEGPDALLADGTRVAPDAVVLATGYRAGLEGLVGHFGVLGADGLPVARGGATAPSAPGLWFTGFTNPISGMFREFRIDAKRIARAVRKAA